jgi:hypothetical protein
MMYKIDRYCIVCLHRCVWNVLINRNLFLVKCPVHGGWCSWASKSKNPIISSMEFGLRGPCSGCGVAND